MEDPTRVQGLPFQRRITMQVMVYLHIKSGRIMVPSTSKTEAGYYLDCEPVEVATASDLPSISQAIKRSWGRGCKAVATPHRDAFPKWVLLKHSGAKTPRELHRQCLMWSFGENSDGGFRIEGFKSLADGRGAESDSATLIVFPSGTLFEDAIEKLMEMMRLMPQGR